MENNGKKLADKEGRTTNTLFGFGLSEGELREYLKLPLGRILIIHLLLLALYVIVAVWSGK
jgi:hypothetical protein